MCRNIDFVSGNHVRLPKICALPFAGCSFEKITGPIPNNYYKTISKTTFFLSPLFFLSSGFPRVLSNPKTARFVMNPAVILNSYVLQSSPM